MFLKNTLPQIQMKSQKHVFCSQEMISRFFYFHPSPLTRELKQTFRPSGERYQIVNSLTVFGLWLLERQKAVSLLSPCLTPRIEWKVGRLTVGEFSLQKAHPGAVNLIFQIGKKKISSKRALILTENSQTSLLLFSKEQQSIENVKYFIFILFDAKPYGIKLLFWNTCNFYGRTGQELLYSLHDTLPYAWLSLVKLISKAYKDNDFKIWWWASPYMKPEWMLLIIVLYRAE